MILYVPLRREASLSVLLSLQELSLTEALKDEGLLTTGNSRHQK